MPKTQTKHTKTDWERVKREAAQEAPIAHVEDDGPYDPNDGGGPIYDSATGAQLRGFPS
jgi:hypothetical protein